MQLSEPMPSYSHVPKAGDTRLAEPMPRLLHVPKRVTCNFPNRCPDYYTFPSG